jgi:hypothetical protein
MGSYNNREVMDLLCLKALLTLLVLLTLIGLLSYIKGRPFLPIDFYDGVAYPRLPTVSTAETAKDLWNLGTLERPHFHKLYEYFLQQSKINANVAYRQDVFTETVAGHLLPKHPVVISVMAAPFYGIFGQAGFWIFQQLIILALIISFYRVAKDLAGRDGALLACGLLTAGTNLVWYYSYNFSYDVLGAMFIMAGFFYLKKFPFLAGALFGLALYVRLANGIILPFLVLAYYPPRVDRWASIRPWFYVLIGCSIVLFPYLIFNRLIYGDALKGSYALTPIFVRGSVVYDENATQFAWKFFQKEAGDRLWGKPESLFFAYPALLLSIFLTPWMMHGAKSWFIFCLVLGGMSMILFFLSYRWWLEAHGDRFLLPAAFLLLLPMALFFQRRILYH